MWQLLDQYTDIMLVSCHYQNKCLVSNTYLLIVSTHVSRWLSLYYWVFRINGVSRGCQREIFSTFSFLKKQLHISHKVMNINPCFHQSIQTCCCNCLTNCWQEKLYLIEGTQTLHMNKHKTNTKTWNYHAKCFHTSLSASHVQI
jgi:hypothetical protein